jgi:hypothetical protein
LQFVVGRRRRPAIGRTVMSEPIGSLLDRHERMTDQRPVAGQHQDQHGPVATSRIGERAEQPTSAGP